MQNAWKIVVWIVVILILAGGAYYWYTNRSTGTNANTPPSASASQGLPSGDDTSDAALTEDMASVDAQMSALNDDDASVSSAMSDQEVQQAQ